ncbi:neprilysin-21-like [Rhipicephalus microplus]|uniref:neprilysin-21-like n=1 Tax=Rhipicephalus microplus TaxID=6941 RepID=UPI003F6B13C2
MMHAFDIQGLRYNDQRKYARWASAAFMKEYTKRAMCLRQMHRSVERQKARQELSNFYDSENLADLVGVKIAYDGFSSLPRSQRTRILSGTNITAERLYFIAHCVKWCREVQFGSGRYAPDRSRCIVPLMNMPEFSKAFECAGGDLMNPAERCGFWA